MLGIRHIHVMWGSLVCCLPWDWRFVTQAGYGTKRCLGHMATAMNWRCAFFFGPENHELLVQKFVDCLEIIEAQAQIDVICICDSFARGNWEYCFQSWRSPLQCPRCLLDPVGCCCGSWCSFLLLLSRSCSSCMQLLLLCSLVLVRCCLVLAVAVALFVLKPFIFRTRLGTAHEHPCQAKYTHNQSPWSKQIYYSKVLFCYVSLSLQ